MRFGLKSLSGLITVAVLFAFAAAINPTPAEAGGCRSYTAYMPNKTKNTKNTTIT